MQAATYSGSRSDILPRLKSWAFNDDIMKTPPNIVPHSTTQLATADCAVVEANISRGVSSGSSSPTSFLNISYDLQQRFKLVAHLDFTLVRQPYIQYTSASRRLHICNPLRSFLLQRNSFAKRLVPDSSAIASLLKVLYRLCRLDFPHVLR